MPKRLAPRLLRIFGVLALLVVAGLGWGYWTAVSEPAVRRTELRIAGLQAPLRLVLFSDIHVEAPDMPPERLARIVAQVNALKPDLVLIAGDFISEKYAGTHLYSMAAAIAPLAGLKARLGTVAVLGNHDHWNDAPGARAALADAGIRLLSNQAAAIGPLAVGGLDDDFTHRADLPATLDALRALPGPRIMLSHSPDPFADLPADVPLMLAGHTHCGQVALPFLGAVRTMSRYGKRYACGIVREGGKVLIVGAGLGTSGLPLRLGAVPDLWLVTLRPAGAR
ncbi:MAG: metallophosphoesterase [Alphaproteobacteria bacterium]|nr:MAG: metallophosphoesterase [Alphaproteobacteria bacterium]